MTNTPLYQNLDSSFVNFDALVRYLRRRKFTGEIMLGSNGYEASVVFTDEGKLRVTEHDKISGAVIHGEKAFQRIVTRSGQSGCNIDVVRHEAKLPAPQTNGNGKAHSTNGRSKARASNDKPANGMNGFLRMEPFDISLLRPNSHSSAKTPLTNGRSTLNTPELITELLDTVDSSLRRAKLELEPAFKKASGEVSHNHPILDPLSGTVEYTGGRLIVEPEVDDRELVEAVGAVLGRILSRLASNPKFGKVYRFTLQRMRAFQRDRLAGQYDRRLSDMIDELLSE